MATHSSTLALKTPWTEKLGADYYPWGRKESGTTEQLHFLSFTYITMRGFPDSSVGKQSACNAGNLDSTLGLGRFPGEGNGNPLQYSYLEDPSGGVTKHQT